MKKASAGHGVTHTTPPDRNIFLDLGFEPVEAARLLAECERMMADKDAAKLTLLAEIEAWMARTNRDINGASSIMGVSPARIRDALDRKLDKFLIDQLVDMLGQAGIAVEVTVRARE